jgi:ABC-type transport system involved in cytochrome bd biosynthesis fused ATPase/permease subunit
MVGFNDGVELSRRMAKVALARAYMKDASFNLDEPTAALDARV